MFWDKHVTEIKVLPFNIHVCKQGVGDALCKNLSTTIRYHTLIYLFIAVLFSGCDPVYKHDVRPAFWSLPKYLLFIALK